MAVMLTPRPTCYRCFRPEAFCLCGRIRPVANRCHVIVLQHPRERRHPFGTARFARLGLKSADVVSSPDVTASMSRLLVQSASTALLYPSATATRLDRRSCFPDCLVVLDGTWSQARTLLRTHRWLERLPCVTLPPGAPGGYRFRREPASHCLSTIEATVRALQLIEPQTEGLDGLLEAFESMVREQLAVTAERVAARGLT